MSATRHDEPAPHVSSQVAATALHAQRFAREESAKKIFGEIKTACNEAKQEYRRVRDFALDPNTSGPRGTRSTQHGEIAERLTVADTNVTAILDGRRPTATYDVARKGPVDIIVDNIPIQSKYGKSTYLSLREIIQHPEEKGSDSLLGRTINPGHYPSGNRYVPDTNAYLRLRTSATLARAVSVPDELILNSTEEVDVFMAE